jgi:ribosomal protein S27AE
MKLTGENSRIKIQTAVLNLKIEFKKDKNFKILENKTCPQCNNAVRFNFKACGSCGYVFR